MSDATKVAPPGSGQCETYAGGIQKGLGGYGLGLMGREEIRHELEKTIIAPVVPQPVEKKRALLGLELEKLFGCRSGEGTQPAILGPMRGQGLAQIARIQILIIGCRAGG